MPHLPHQFRLGRLWAALCVLSVGLAGGEPDTAAEYEVKAAMLVNFSKFVEWPDGSGPLTIGVIGRDPFGPSLDAVIREQRSATARPIVVRREAQLSKEPVHVLFIARSERRRMPELLGQVAGRAVLTVSDAEGFVRQGGMIEFTLEDDRNAHRVRFACNVKAAQKAGVRISSRLLKLATVTVESGGGPALVGGGGTQR